MFLCPSGIIFRFFEMVSDILRRKTESIRNEIKVQAYLASYKIKRNQGKG